MKHAVLLIGVSSLSKDSLFKTNGSCGQWKLLLPSTTQAVIELAPFFGLYLILIISYSWQACTNLCQLVTLPLIVLKNSRGAYDHTTN